MRIVIDMQVAQIEGESLGAGRYATAFAQAIVRNRGQHEVFLALSGLSPSTIEPIRAAFDGLLRQENIRVWYAPCSANPGNAAERNLAALLKESFIASLNPDVVHIFALDEEHVYSENVSICSFEKGTPVTIALDADTATFPPRKNEASESNRLWILFSESDSFESNLDSDIKKSVIAILRPSFEKDGQMQLDHPHSESIQGIINTWQKMTSAAKNIVQPAHTRKTLAFVSPMPPERTGIADYSAELLPALNKYYDIILVVEQNKLDPTFRKKFRVEDSRWLFNNKHLVDRVLYQVGNAPYHQHILDLIKEIPGTVVLHDFYLGHLRHWKEVYVRAHEWHQSLYESHGYQALIDAQNDIESAKLKYPVNWDIIANSAGIIIHSNYSYNLAKKWTNINDKIEFNIIPLLRSPSTPPCRKKSRKKLNILANDFVVCSFGFLGATKLNDRLLNAWLNSSLASDHSCHLIYVGENSPCKYGEKLKTKIQSTENSERIHITGFASNDLYQQYLSAADVAVQLRTSSRGETSAAVMDCMNYGLPLIVNANGSMSEIDPEAVLMLPDEFTDKELTAALEHLWRDVQRRQEMAKNSKNVILERHTPIKCAALYYQAIELHYQKSLTSLTGLIGKVTKSSDLKDISLLDLSEAIDKTISCHQPAKRLFLDITATYHNDLKTGIERVARALINELIKVSNDNFRVEPVYLSKNNGNWCYKYARDYTFKLLELEDCLLSDDVADIGSGDVVLGLDLSGSSIIEAVKSGYIQSIRNDGASVYFTIFDLLPIRMPQVFPPGAQDNHRRWLEAISYADGVIAISKHVSDDFEVWLNETGLRKDVRKPFHIRYFHLGADIDNTSPTQGLPEDSEAVIKKIKSNPTFLMVGTIEPRKGYAFTLDAFDRLWNQGLDVNLVIVGREGWVGLPRELRRDIPETIERLRNHPERSERLFFLENISDEYLKKLYKNCDALVAASFDEGFGLPLIEAAQHQLAIIARDIPIFREVVGNHAYYFNGSSPDSLSNSIKKWLDLYFEKKHPKTLSMTWLTWHESAKSLLPLLSIN